MYITDIEDEELETMRLASAKFGSIGGQLNKKRWANMSQEEKDAATKKRKDTMLKNGSKSGRPRIHPIKVKSKLTKKK